MPSISDYYMYIKKRGFLASIVHHSIQLFLPILKLLPQVRNNKTFKLNNREYTYYRERVGATWASERSVEVPVFLELLSKGLAHKADILEIGNVLTQYQSKPCTWTVVDKYEVGKGVLNEDIVDFNAGKKYDLVLSVSTMEHVGFDEDIVDDQKIENSVNNIVTNLLKPNGTFIFSVPLCYNQKLDKLIFNKKLKATSAYFMKRTEFLTWEQVTSHEVHDADYGNIYYGSASAIAILVINLGESSNYNL